MRTKRKRYGQSYPLCITRLYSCIYYPALFFSVYLLGHPVWKYHLKKEVDSE
jgi:hypothetical protein